LVYASRVHPALPGLAITILFFLGAEGILCASGVSTLAEESDPFRGFSERVRVFGLDAEGNEYERSRGASTSFNQQRFLAEKPPEGFRFFVLGGSSAYGFPWGASAAFPRYLGDAIQTSWPDRIVEAVNAGGMSYASHRLRILAHEVLDYEPDLLVIYGGHNEFVERSFYGKLMERPRGLDALRDALHHTRLFSAMTRLYLSQRDRGGDEAPDLAPNQALGMNVVREDEARVTAEDRHEVRALFEENLRAVVEMATEAGVQIVLCTVPSNSRDWAPRRSTFPPGTPSEDRDAVGRHLSNGRSALKRGNATAALDELEAADQLAPGHAHVLFELGRTYEALGRWDEARSSYVRARDADGSPTRAVSELNVTIRELAADEDVALIDIERFFETTARNGLLGFNLFEDYVHPTREAHKLIALELWKHVMEAGLLGAPRSADEQDFWAAVRESERDRLASGSEPSSETPMLLFNLGVVLLNQGLNEQALEKFREAVALDPGYWGAWLNIGLIHARSGRYEQAVVAYKNVLRIRPGHVRSLLGLGWSLRFAGKLGEAQTVFLQATRNHPDSAAAWRDLGSLQLAQTRPRDAEAALRTAVRLDPRDADAHWMLGAALAEQQRHAEAVPSLQAALRLRPGHRQARAALDRIRRTQGG
jgi:tetratricopeptide (TPR) repeat protein